MLFPHQMLSNDHVECSLQFPSFGAIRVSGIATHVSRSRFKISLARAACSDWLVRLDPGAEARIEIPLPGGRKYGGRLMTCKGEVRQWTLQSDSSVVVDLTVRSFAIRETDPPAAESGSMHLLRRAKGAGE